jgi:hypothetical protein
LFGIKEALRLNKRWLYGARKLIVETDAKYIKGMLENPDMMPTATINRWIDEVLMYHFTLRHKAGATFGPDGLSRRTAQGDDPVYEPCSDDEEEGHGVCDYEVADPSEPGPLQIEEFVDSIDSRTGFYQGIARSIEDFDKELQEATLEKTRETDSLRKGMEECKDAWCADEVNYVTQLLEVLALPSEEDRIKGLPYEEGHRSLGAIEQDRLIIHIKRMLVDAKHKPANLSKKLVTRLGRLVKRFVWYKGKVYRRGINSKHRLYVSEKN